jgi:hypothetical protein
MRRKSGEQTTPPGKQKEIGMAKYTNLSPPEFCSLRCLPQLRFYVALGPAPEISGGTLATCIG